MAMSVTSGGGGRLSLGATSFVSNIARPFRTKIGTVKQLGPGNKPAMAFFSKIANLTHTRRGQSSKCDLILP